MKLPNYAHPYDIMQALGKTSGKNDKLEILKSEAGNMLWKEVCDMALNPMIKYGMTKPPKIAKHVRTITTLEDLGAALHQIKKILHHEKLRGHAAEKFVRDVLEQVDDKSCEVICRIIEKDLDCGVDTAVNKVWKNFIQEWPVMLCVPDGDLPAPYIAQLKNDGMRINIMVEDGTVSYFSRTGRPQDYHGRFDKMFLKMAGKNNVVYDGEGLLKMADGKWMSRKAGNGIIKKAGLKGISEAELDMLHFALWDVIDLAAWKKGRWEMPYTDRLTMLETHVERGSNIVHVTPGEVVDSDAEAQKLFEKYVGQGLEGIIKKAGWGPWENDRVDHQIKVKAEREADLRVVGIIPHSKDPKLTGSLICETSCGKLRTGVGSGLTDDDRTKGLKFWMDKVVALVYNEIIEDKKTGMKSMFLPRFIEVRTDKNKADALKDLK